MAKNFYKRNSIINPEVENAKIIDQIVGNFEVRNKILLFGEVQSGKTNNLINIILGLLEEEKVDYVFYVTGNTINLKEQNFVRFHDALHSQGVKLVDADLSFLKKDINSETSNGKVVITVIKQYFNDVKRFIEKNLVGKKVLIIDDEADDYSNSEKNLNIINELVEKGISLISCTATPFLNLYVNEETYDSFYKLTPWHGYHGRKSFEKNKVIVPDTEGNNDEIYLSALINWAKTIYENNLTEAQILFNIDNGNDVHFLTKVDIFELCTEIIYSKEHYKKIYENATGNEINMEKVSGILQLAITNGIKILNCEVKDKLENKGFEIIIGGILLSRGITYENLLTEVFLNIGEKIKAHTLVQRSRWFGYRGKNKPLIKIYLESKTNEAYSEIEFLYDLTLNHYLNKEIKYSDKINQVKNNWERIMI